MIKFCIALTLFFCFHGQSQNSKISLFFKVNVNELTPESSALLDSLTKSGNLSDVKLVGFADLRGDESMNLLLSESRVNAIAHQLNSNNIEVMESSFYGENYPINSKNTSNYAFWRRVDLIFSRLEPEPISLNNLDVNLITDGNLDAIPLKLEFYNASADIMPYSTPELEKLLEFMSQNNSVNAFLRGHVCCDGGGIGEFYSNLRAEAVYLFLINHGIASERLSFQGFGSTIPLVWPEKNEMDKQRNRRVDVVFSIK